MFASTPSYGMSPTLGRPSYDSRPEDMTRKDPSSPAVNSGFSFDRRPLSPLGLNNNSFGVRQRRQANENVTTPTTNLEGHSTTLPQRNKYINVDGPPRFSLSMSNGNAPISMVSTELTTDLATRSSTKSPAIKIEEYWILVFGFRTKKQYEEILGRFKRMGNVISVKSAPTSNWVALSYDSPLTAEMACGSNPLQLSDGCVCGVLRLSESDRYRFFAHQATIGTIIEYTVGLDGRLSRVSHSSGLFPMKSDMDEADMDEGQHDLSESDVLLLGHDDKLPTKKSSMCTKFMSYIYGWK